MALSGMPDLFLNKLLKPGGGSQPALANSNTDGEAEKLMSGEFDESSLLPLFKQFKRESFDNRWIFERQWMRNIHYINNRQWIYYVSRFNEWRDVRLAKWIPRPVTNMCKQTLTAIRAMFAAVSLSANVRPIGSDPKNISVATTANEYEPILAREHDIPHVLNEADFWFIATGNVFIHTFLERDVKHGVTTVALQQCMECGEIHSDDEIQQAGGVCPDCQAQEFQPAVDPETGAPATRKIPNGRGKTVVLSPFEIAFPNTHARFSDVPYVIWLRWRSRSYYENNPALADQVKGVAWSKAPSEQALQLFRSLPTYNDVGIAPFLSGGTGSSGAANGSGGADEEGIAEYELWMRPNDAYPQGLVARFIGDKDPILLHQEDDEAVPGPLPYTDAGGTPIFTFSHAAFEQVGGRVYGSGPIDAIIQKQNQLNQLDSMIQMIIQRMSNPVWMVPKGSEIEKFTGEPGLVVKWNPLTVGGNAKPERIAGEGPHGSFFQIREQYLQDIEQLAGTYDILKGQKPAGVDSFAGMQLLVERSQGRFASAFQARGEMYKDWFQFALEIEREFGPDQRTEAILSPARNYTFQNFKRAQLEGAFQVIVEDGATKPKTNLGTRAAIEHLNQLGFINPNDPDQKYKIYSEFGMGGLSPALDIHVQAALQKQEAFETWASDPMAMKQSTMQMQQETMQYQAQVAAIPPTPAQIDPATGQDIAPQPELPPPPSPTKHTPLAWKPWYEPSIHLQEFMKWANGDKVRALLLKNPQLEAILAAALQEIEGVIQQKMMAMQAAQGPPPGQPGDPKKPGGAGAAMNNSNKNSAGLPDKGSAQRPGAA